MRDARGNADFRAAWMRARDDWGTGAGDTIGGSISQWYPERSGGEQMPSLPWERLPTLKPVDFSCGHEGSAAWQVDVLPRDTTIPLSPPRNLETVQWPRARVAAANRVRSSKGEVENFIFYRGIG